MKIYNLQFTIYNLIFLLFTFYFLLFTSPGPAFAQDYVPHQVLVKYKSNASVSSFSVQNLDSQVGVIEKVQLFSEEEFRDEETGALASEDPLLANIYQLTIKEGVDVEEAVKIYQQNEEVEYAEPNYYLEPLGSDKLEAEIEGPVTIPKDQLPTFPNDPDLERQWNLGKIQIFDAWEIEKGNPGIVVAILDTGIDSDHPEFLERALPGKNFISKASSPEDTDGHGSATAGIVAAQVNNAQGIAGVGYQIKVLPLKILKNYNTPSSNVPVPSAVVYAVNQGVKVILLNVEAHKFCKSLKQAIKYADQNGVLTVAPVGSTRFGKDPSFPANFPEVLAVSPSNSEDSASTPYSYQSLAAPGEGIYTTKEGKYTYFTGPSAAAAHVAGVAALLFSQDPTPTANQVRRILEQTADKVGVYPYEMVKGKISSWNPYLGYGRLNAFAALQKGGAGPTPTPRPSPCSPKNWFCEDDDVTLPEVWCCQFNCLPYEVWPPYECPTNKDWGQKDGTGQKEENRRYFYYDYDLEKTIEVPPAMPAQITPTPAPPPTCNPPSGWPAGQGRVTLTYRACHPTEGCHSGIDIVTSENKPVYSTLSGKVVFAGDSGGYGKTVFVECGGWKYAVGFSHLNSIRVQVGQEVVAGKTVVGTEGRTGRLTASHLHYRVWGNGQLVDPAPFIPYRGCVDWTENNLGGGFCPGSNCTPQCPNTPACGKAREQGQCTTAASLQKTLAGLVQKIGRFFTALIQEIKLV